MADKREQCEKCTMNCPPNIIQSKINKGRIPFDKCMDFSPIQTNAMKIRSMTDEELAEFLSDEKCKDEHDYCSDFGHGCYYYCKKDHACYDNMKQLYSEWLQSEAE